MNNKAIDMLITDLAEEAQSGQSDEYARSLMRDAFALLSRYRLQVAVSESIALVLNQAQAICEHPCPKWDMVGPLRVYGQRMQKAARECLEAHKVWDRPKRRQSPEDVARSALDAWAKSADHAGLDFFVAKAIREDRLNANS